jgi:hypothetical protein
VYCPVPLVKTNKLAGLIESATMVFLPGKKLPQLESSIATAAADATLMIGERNRTRNIVTPLVARAARPAKLKKVARILLLGLTGLGIVIVSSISLCSLSC